MSSFTQHDEEHIKQRFHQTKLVLLGPGLLTALFLYIPWSLLIKYELRESFSMILWLYSIAVLGYFSRAYAIWWRIKYVITNERIIKISHDGLFKKIVIETPLERILNVSYKTTGLFSSVLGFGDVEIQVVGLIDPIILHHVRQPGKLRDSIWQAHERSLKKPHSFEADSIPHIQEQIGYTKKNQRVL